MQPLNMFCSNSNCPSVGQLGKGNIIWHQKSTGRLKCTVCKKTFSHHKDTPFFGLRKTRSVVTLIVLLMVHGCPPIAIVKAFGFDRRTVNKLAEKAGNHCQTVHQQLVESPRDHGQVQADEIRGKVQGSKSWIAMAIAVSSRLWLGAVTGQKRSRNLIDNLAAQVRRCTISGRPLLIVTDGLKAYIKSFKRAFKESIKVGSKGRPRKKQATNLVLVQCVKSYSQQGKRYICHGVHRCFLAIGTFAELSSLIKVTQTTMLVHTAYIERLNASFRQAICGLTRKTRCLLVKTERLNAWVYLKGTVYNFCQPQASLGKGITPAMAAGITQHIWSINELLQHRVPPPIWKPSKRGPRTEKDREIIHKWRPDLATR